MSEQHWSDAEPPDDMADPINNILWAVGQMVDAIHEDRYRYERVHVEADLRYLRGEARRAKRLLSHRSAPVSDQEPNRGHLDDGNDERPADV